MQSCLTGTIKPSVSTAPRGTFLVIGDACLRVRMSTYGVHATTNSIAVAKADGCALLHKGDRGALIPYTYWIIS